MFEQAVKTVLPKEATATSEENFHVFRPKNKLRSGSEDLMVSSETLKMRCDEGITYSFMYRK